MFDRNLWNEIMLTISMRRRQSLMTAFGVFWGILLLVLLVGVGIGLDNGVVEKVQSLPPNEMWIMANETSIPYKGFDRGRKWLFNSRDEELIRQRFGKWVASFCPICYAGFQNVTHDNQTAQFQVTGIVPQFVDEMPQRVTAGRFINDIDMQEHRKVCVIGERVADVLFDSHQDAVGRIINVNGMQFTVVGVTHCTNRNINIGIELSDCVLLPLPTQQTAYGRGDEIDMCCVIMRDDFPMERLKESILSVIRENHSIHPDDLLAISASTVTEIVTKYNNVITACHILIWIVGLGTLIAGLVGIANIMLVSVKERIQEIGIRRAVGARPYDVIRQIVLESLVLTLSAGLAGLCVAIWVLALVNEILPQGDDAVFAQPFIPLWMTVLALLILVAGGVVAGLIPALHALAVKPVDALREE